MMVMNIIVNDLGYQRIINLTHSDKRVIVNARGECMDSDREVAPWVCRGDNGQVDDRCITTKRTRSLVVDIDEVGDG